MNLNLCVYIICLLAIDKLYKKWVYMVYNKYIKYLYNRIY